MAGLIRLAPAGLSPQARLTGTLLDSGATIYPIGFCRYDQPFLNPPRVASRAKGSTFYKYTTTYELLIMNKKEGEQAEKPETRQRFLTRQQRANHDMTKTQPWTYFNILQVFIVWKDVGLRQNLHTESVTLTQEKSNGYSPRCGLVFFQNFLQNPRSL